MNDWFWTGVFAPSAAEVSFYDKNDDNTYDDEDYGDVFLLVDEEDEDEDEDVFYEDED